MQLSASLRDVHKRMWNEIHLFFCYMGFQEDAGWEERLKRKSLIERVPSLVVVTPSPSCSSESPPPLKDPGLSLEEEHEDEDSEDSGRITPKADEDLSQMNEGTGSECGTLSDDTDSDLLRSDFKMLARPGSTTSSTGTVSSGNSTLTLTAGGTPVTPSSAILPGKTAMTTTTGASLPQPDVIPDVQQLQIIRTKGSSGGGPKLDVSMEYYSLDTVVLLGPSSGEDTKTDTLKKNKKKEDCAVEGGNENSHMGLQSPNPLGSATSGKVRGARVVLDANGEIIFASETLRRKRKPKVSFDPGSAVKTMDYDNCSTYGRVRESVYDRIRKESNQSNPEKDEKLYECIEEIRRQNMNKVPLILEEQRLLNELRAGGSLLERENCGSESRPSSASSNSSARSALAQRYANRPPMTPPSKEGSPSSGAKVNVLLETDLDSAIPPSMPDLKNLPKIKDRLKRNESYRIANKDDIPGGPQSRTSPSPPPPSLHHPNTGGLNNTTLPQLKASPLGTNNLNGNNNKFLSGISRRMSFSSHNNNNILNNEISPDGNLHLNKKRDILEEDPAFIAQILNMNNTSAKSPNANPFSSRITLSKLALSQDDRPSFLRRGKLFYTDIW
jgi:hypothetical protein